jgi:hypothetical protein
MMPDPCPNDSKVITNNLMIQSAEMIKKKIGGKVQLLGEHSGVSITSVL